MKELKLLLWALVALLAFSSCDENTEEGEYDNWKERNIQFVDSIANVARTNADGSWKVFLTTGLDTARVWPNEYYVYCKVISQGEGYTHPAFTDTIEINYNGRLIPSKNNPEGYLFDCSYEGVFDPQFDVPVSLPLNETVAGFYTAVQHMCAGDTWKLYIPYELGYGDTDRSYIPAYSTLIFDINLVSFHHVGETLSK